jgi:scyllo-inositol 2-dehydrogenase (NADP+)
MKSTEYRPAPKTRQCSRWNTGGRLPERLKSVVVGLGRIGWQFHFKETVASDQFDLLAVVDPLAIRVEEAVSESGCAGYASYGEMLAHESPDVIALATPTTFHEQQTLQAIEHGCHVILEKPMTTSLVSADRMIDAARQNDRRIFVYQPHRLNALTSTVKSVIDSGKLGPLFSIKRSVFRYTRRNDWQSLRKNGGGMLNNYGAHYIDQLLYLSGHAEIADARCHLWAAATCGDADDVVRVWLKTAQNVLLDLEINQVSALSLPELHICGAYGTLLKSGPSLDLRYYQPNKAPPLEVIEGAAPGRSYDNKDILPWIDEQIPVGKESLDFYANIHDVITNQATPYIPVEQTRELMRTMEICRENAEF